MNARLYQRLGLLALLMGVMSLTTGGCAIRCDSDGKNEVKEVVDEVGDKVEDVVHEAKKDK